MSVGETICDSPFHLSHCDWFNGQTGGYEPGAAHVTHLIESDSKECKVKSSRLHIACRSCWVIAIVYAQSHG